MKRLMKKAMLAVLVIAAAVTIQTTEAQAAKKPGQVKNIEETKKTDTSFTFKFKKVKNAKKYQVRVYEAKGVKKTIYFSNGEKSSMREWQATKKLVKKAECTTNKCTIKGLAQGRLYAVKIRACNGNKYGKWATQFISTYYKGSNIPGRSSATGKLLKTQYNNWKKRVLREMKEEKITDDGLLQWLAGQLDYFSEIQCVEMVYDYVADPNKYSMEDLYQVYKTGMGSDLDIYHIVMDIYKDLGIPCTIKPVEFPNGNNRINNINGKYFYQFYDTKNKVTFSRHGRNSFISEYE